MHHIHKSFDTEEINIIQTNINTVYLYQYKNKVLKRTQRVTKDPDHILDFEFLSYFTGLI
jgi:hypothetical protein